MKKILLILLIAFSMIFTSCSTVHKITNSSHKQLDSVVSVVKDTTSITKQSTETQGFTATGVDVDVYYGDDTTSNRPIIDTTPQGDQISTIIKDAVSASSATGRIPKEVKIHFDTVKDTTSSIVTSDSTVGKTVTKANVKETLNTSSKDVTTKGLGFGWSLTIALIGLAALVAGGIWVVKKLKIV